MTRSRFAAIFTFCVFLLGLQTDGFADDSVENFDDTRVCAVPAFSGSVGSVSVPPTSYVIRVAGTGSQLQVTTYNPVTGTTAFSVLVNIGGGITATGGWGGAVTDRITSISATGNVLRINGATAITFSGMNPTISGISTWANGVTRIAAASSNTFTFTGYSGGAYSSGNMIGTGNCSATVQWNENTSGLSRFTAVVPGANLVTHSVDGVAVGTTSFPHNFDFDTSTVSNGRHIYRFTANWPDGSVVNWGPYDFVVQNSLFDSSGYHSCALVAGGGVKCWGYNSSGQLGNGTTTQSAVPVVVSGLPGAASQITTGWEHSCAIVSGAVWCWGSNGSGQLGNGTTTSSSVPVMVPGLPTNMKMVQAGYGFSCGFNSTGSLYCWGRNDYGQLGNGTTTGSTVPVAISTPSAVRILSSGAYSSCYARFSTLGCWGDNTYGQLGLSGAAPRLTPTLLTTSPGRIASLAIDSISTCTVSFGVTGAGTHCWGTNTNGTLGNGTYTNSIVPVLVSGLTVGVGQSVTSVYQTNCAVLASGAMKCWGLNQNGVLGNGSAPFSNSNVPVDVTGMASGATHVGGNNLIVCARKTGQLSCWGQNYYGAVGTGVTGGSYNIPAAVVGL